MPQKRYIVALDDTERQYLEALAKTGKESAYRITRARCVFSGLRQGGN